MARGPIPTIIETCKACRQNIAGAARHLGIDRRTPTRRVERGWRKATGSCREKLVGLAQAQGLEVSASTIHRHSQRAVLVRPQHQAAAAPSPPRPWLSPDGREVHHPGALWAAVHLLSLCSDGHLLSLQGRADPPHAGGLRCPGRGDGVGAPGGMSGERGFWEDTNPIFIAVLRAPMHLRCR